MAILVVNRRLCVNENLVPVKHVTLPFVDPYKLADDEPEENLKVTLVEFLRASNTRWINAVLELPHHWWAQHLGQVPLRQEILELIKAKKPQKGRQILMPKQHKALLPLNIRGQTLWFQNNSQALRLALRQNQEEEQLSGDPDVQHAPDDPDTPDDPDDSDEPVLADEVRGHLVEEVLTKVQAHVQCASVIWLQSRHSFRITRKDKVFKQVRVANLKKKLSQALETENYQNLQQAFHMALAQGEEFLNSAWPSAWTWLEGEGEDQP